jgi:hypothetical protein
MVNINKESLVAPLLLSSISTFDSNMKGYQKVYESYGAKYYALNLKGSAFGYFETSSSLLLIYATVNNYISISANVTLSINETEKAYSSPVKVRIPVDGPIWYWLKPFKVVPQDPLASLVTEIYNLTIPAPKVLIDAGCCTVLRNIETKMSYIPLNNASYIAESEMKPLLPFLTVVNETFSSESKSTPSYVEYDYQWSFSGHTSATSFAWPLPYLVYIKHNNEKYLLLMPTSNRGLRLVQIDETYRGFATVLSGIDVNVYSSNESVICYVFKVNDMGSYYQVNLTLLSNSNYVLEFNVNRTKDVVLNLRPGVYLIMSTNPTRPLITSSVTLIKVY